MCLKDPDFQKSVRVLEASGLGDHLRVLPGVGELGWETMVCSL